MHVGSCWPFVRQLADLLLCAQAAQGFFLPSPGRPSFFS